MEKNPEILLWVFFVSQGITDNSDVARAHILCMDICKLGMNATIESVKNSIGYKSCLYDIPDQLITDEKLQEMINFK